MRRAAAKKILRESENRGGSGAGSFSPVPRGGRGGVPVAGRGVAFSVALIVRSRLRRIVLAVLVLVRERAERRRVDRDDEWGVSGGGHGERDARLVALLVPRLQRPVARRHAVETKTAVPV